MKKLTYVIAMMVLLLTGCSQDESVMENKGELVTLNYNVSLGSGVQSRTGEEPELAVNKLICAVFEADKEKYREIVDIDANGNASFTPKLLDNTTYNIVFWAYYENNDKESCYKLEDLKVITVNSNYDTGVFSDNAKKDAFTFVDKEVNLSKNQITRDVELTRPFGKVTVMTSKEDYQAAIGLNGTPIGSKLTIEDYNDVFNALTGEWRQSDDNSIILESEVQNVTSTLADDETTYISLANEYLFAGGNGETKTDNCRITVIVIGEKTDENGETEEFNMYNKTIENVPVGSNASTNMYNENLLTGGGVTYSISINPGFSNASDEDIENDAQTENTEKEEQ